MENTQIGVSIVCNAFNHERYIAQALESFLMQKTDFPFEILVHDDASTDGTAEIIRTYAKRFPHIVLPLFQPENLKMSASAPAFSIRGHTESILRSAKGMITGFRPISFSSNLTLWRRIRSVPGASAVQRR